MGPASVAAEGARAGTPLSAYDLECLYLKGVTTATFFRGGAAEAAAGHLQARVAAVLRVNPWLAGRLVKGSPPRLEWQAELSEAEASAAAEVHVALAPPAGPEGLRHGCSYAALDKAINNNLDLEVPFGSVCISKNLPIFKVSVVPESGDPAAFAVVVSLSHTVCDGATFNAVRNMLSEGAPVKALDARRPEGFDFVQACKAAFGADTQGYLMGGAIMCYFLTTGFFGRRKKLSLRQVGGAEVEKAKTEAKAAGAVPYVSTNDVVTSAFFRASKCRNGHMAVDCRGRIEGCTPDLAGNNEFFIMYEPSDFASPALIRQSLPKLRRAAVPATRFPGFFGRCRARIAMVSNWTTNAQELQLPGCEHVLQVPYQDPGFVMCETWVVFQPRAGETAVLCLTSDDLSRRSPAECAVFAEPLEGISTA